MFIMKLNSKFRKHGRVLFGVFTVVIIISFLGFLTPGQFGCDFIPGGGDSTRVGTAFGEAVTMGELNTLRRKLSIISEMSGQRDPGMSNEQLFYIYCPLKHAEKMGIIVSDKEVADLVAKTPVFNGKNGKFDLNKYKEIIGRLRSYGISEQEVYDSLRLLLLQQKMYAIMMNEPDVSEEELDELFRLTNTTFVLRAACFDYKSVEKSVPAVKEKALLDYFQRNRNKYRKDGRVKALIAVVPANGFRKEVQKKITAQDISDYYKTNRNMFLGKDNKPEPLNKVQGKIVEKLIELRITELAAERANRFAVAAYDAVAVAKNKSESEKAFRELASKEKILIVEAPETDFSAEKIGGIESAELLSALGTLAGGNPVTAVISGATGAYVGYLQNRIAPRLAEFKEVKSKVNSDYRHDEAVKLARTMADRGYMQLQKATTLSARLNILNKLPDSMVSTVSFSMVKMPEKGFDPVMQSVLTMRVGEFSTPQAGSKGVYLIILERRIGADMKKFADNKNVLKFQALMQKQQRRQLEVQQALMSQCRWELKENDSSSVPRQ